MGSAYQYIGVLHGNLEELAACAGEYDNLVTEAVANAGQWMG